MEPLVQYFLHKKQTQLFFMFVFGFFCASKIRLGGRKLHYFSVGEDFFQAVRGLPEILKVNG